MVSNDAALITKGIKKRCGTNFQFCRAVVMQTNLCCGVQTFKSEDLPLGQRCEQVTTVNPFADANLIRIMKKRQPANIKCTYIKFCSFESPQY
jgi:hypothetical protein